MPPFDANGLRGKGFSGSPKGGPFGNKASGDSAKQAKLDQVRPSDIPRNMSAPVKGGDDALDKARRVAQNNNLNTPQPLSAQSSSDSGDGVGSYGSPYQNDPAVAKAKNLSNGTPDFNGRQPSLLNQLSPEALKNLEQAKGKSNLLKLGGQLLGKIPKNIPGAERQPAKDAVTDNQSAQPTDSLKDLGNKAKDLIHEFQSDPRQLLANIADEQLGLGEKVGGLLWIIWGALTLVGALSMPPIIGGLPFLIVFNLLLVKPKWVYRLTVLILDLFGVGEALEAADKIGLDKVDIRIKAWQKLAIILVDIIYFMVIALVLYLLISGICSLFGGYTTGAVARIADWWNNTTGFQQANDFCAKVNEITPDDIKKKMYDLFSGAASSLIW